MSNTVDILLSTDHGAQWLPDLLSSLIEQSYKDWRLFVRDDGSTDNTTQLLEEFSRDHAGRVAWCELDQGSIGRSASFSRLVQRSSAPYLMFCDQNDFWLPEKVASDLAHIREMSCRLGEDRPLLHHSDLVVINEDDTLRANSLWRYHGYDIGQDKFAYLQNSVVTGGAAIFNRSAAELAFPRPIQAMAHDTWLALCCAWFGDIQASGVSFLRRRSHSGIHHGASTMLDVDELNQRANRWSAQAEAFKGRFEARFDKTEKMIVDALAQLRHLTGWDRRYHIIENNFYQRHGAENLALLLFA